MFMFMQRIRGRRNNETGASAVEYGLLVAAIAAIIVLIVFAIGKFVKAGFEDTCVALKTNETTNVSTVDDGVTCQKPAD